MSSPFTRGSYIVNAREHRVSGDASVGNGIKGLHAHGFATSLGVHFVQRGWEKNKKTKQNKTNKTKKQTNKQTKKNFRFSLLKDLKFKPSVSADILVIQL